MNALKKQILFYFILTNLLYSQSYNQKNNFNDSLTLFDKIINQNLKLIQSEKIKKLTTSYNDLNDKKITVFKIQLNSLNDSRSVAQNDATRYEKIFYPEKIKIVYESPYFKAKTDYLLQKIDAEKKLKKIEKYFKNAFILEEKISIEELNINNL